MSSSCLQGQVRFGVVVLLFILGSSLGGVGPVRGLRGEGSVVGLFRKFTWVIGLSKKIGMSIFLSLEIIVIFEPER